MASLLSRNHFTRLAPMRLVAPAVLLCVATAPLGAQQLDPTFASSGSFRATRTLGSDFGEDVAIDSKGRRVVAWSEGDDSDTDTKQVSLMRFGAGGQLDTSFGFAGVTSIATPRAEIDLPLVLGIDGQDRPVVGFTMFDTLSTTQNRDFFVQRFTEAGVPDAGLQVSPSAMSARDELRAMAFAPDGDLILVGETYLSATDTDWVFAVVEDDGLGGLQADAAFGNPTTFFDLGDPGGFRMDTPQDVIVQGDFIVAAGLAVGNSGETSMAVARLSRTTGNLDLTFGTGGKETFKFAPIGMAEWTANVAFALAAVPSGGYILGGWGKEEDLEPDHLLALRIDINGDAVLTWGVGGWFLDQVPVPGALSAGQSVAHDLAVGDQGQAFLVGEVEHPTTGTRLGAIAALNAQGVLDASFSQDGFETYTFEPAGEPTNSYFLAVAADGNGRLFLGGTTKRVVGATTALDQDVLAAMVFVNGMIFGDNFERGSATNWP